MNLKLKPGIFLTGFLPGFLFIIGCILIYYKFDFSEIFDWIGKSNVPLSIGIVVIILSFIIGQLFDSFRDGIIEQRIENYCKEKKIKDINWDFFNNASEKKIDKLDNSYFIFYVLNLNLAICLGFLTIILLIDLSAGCLQFVKFIVALSIFIISILLLVIDAVILRREIVRHTNKEVNGNILPHNNVYSRIRISQHGVGVFAIVDIPKGTYIFEGDKSELCWFTEKKLALSSLPQAIQELYNDFCVIKTAGNQKLYGCPENFNNMPISWYLNESDNPNMACDEDFDFYTIHDVKAGEELTAKYDSYSE